MQLKKYLNKIYIDKKETGFFLLMMSLISAIFRSQVSFLLYLCVLTLFLGVLINIREVIRLKNYFKRKLIIWGLVIIFFTIPILYEVITYNNLYSELFNLVYIVGLFIGLYSYFISDYKIYKDRFFKLFKWLFIIFGVYVVIYYSALLIISGSINVMSVRPLDNNFFSLNLLILLLLLFENLNKQKNKGKILFINLLFILISLLIIFSGSRRGILVFVLFNIGFIIYSIVKTKGLKKILLYLSFTTISLSMILYLAIGPNSTLRVYLVERFSSNSQELKSQITQVEYKYFKALVSEVDYSSFYHKLWNTTNKKQYIINNLLSEKHKNNYSRVDRKENYNEAIKELYYFSLLKSDLEKTKLLANDIAINIPDSFFLASNIKSIPYYVNIPYKFSNSINLGGYVGLYPIEYDIRLINGISRLFVKFRTTNKSKAQIFINSPGIAGNYSVEFLTDSLMSVPLLLVKSQKAKKNECEVTDVYTYDIDDGFKKVKIDFQIKNQSAVKRIYLVWEEKPDYLIVSDLSLSYNSHFPEYKLNDAILVSHSKRIQKMNSTMKDQMRKIIRLIKRHESMLLEIMDDPKCENLINDLDKLTYSEIFNNYSNVYFKDSVYCFCNFTEENKYNFRKRIPAIPGSIIHINYKAKIPGFFKHKIVRRPNQNPEFLNSELIDYQVKKLDNNWKEYSLSYRIDSSSTLLAHYVANARKFAPEDTVFVKDVNIDVICNYNVNLEEYSGFYIKPYLVNHDQDSVDLLRKNIMLKLKTDSITLEGSKFLNTRLNRWYLSYLYFKSYNRTEKIIGKGFEYTRIFPVLLFEAVNKKENDSPHNPIISAFLYSGFTGGLIYVVFFIYIIVFYIKRIKHDPVFFTAFSIVFFFSFFSGISHFTIPVFIIFSIIPFVLNGEYVEKKNVE